MGKAKGFTLLELMIAIALIAILASTALPSFMSQRREALMRDTISMIRGDLETARSRAVRENAPAAVLLREDGYSVFIDNGAGGGVAANWVRDGGEKQLFSRRLPHGLKIDMNQVTFESQRTRFNGRGYVANSGTLVVADQDGRSVKLDMNNRFGKMHTQ